MASDYEGTAMTQLDLFGRQDAAAVHAEAWERITSLLDGQRRPVSTGFHELDVAMRGGFRRGRLSLISGHPGMGTTMLALGVAVRAAVADTSPVTVLALDDDPADLLVSAMAGQARVDLQAIEAGDGTDADRFRLAEAGALLAERGFSVVRPQTIDAESVIATARSAVDGGSEVLVVDALDHVPGPGALEAARGMKRLAAQSGAVVVATAHLPQDSWNRPLREVSWASDLGALGVLAQIADAVLLLYRDDRWEPDHPRSSEADLVVAKNPLGGPAATVVAHMPRWAKFRDFAGGYENGGWS